MITMPAALVSLVLITRYHLVSCTPEAAFTLEQRANRQLNLNPQRMPPHPHPPHLKKHHGSSSGYHGCLGLSSYELAAASDYFGDDVPPCAVYVNDTLVAGSGSSSSGSGGGGGGGGSSGSSGGSGSGSSGGSSSGSGGSSSGSSNSDGSSSESESGFGGGGSSSSGESSGSNGDGSLNNDRIYNDDMVNGNLYGGVNGNDDYSSSSPLVYFDITDCGSYSNLWLWDLALSCDNSTSFDNCKCSSAEILFQYGTLECPSSEAPACPSGCPVCNTCMHLMGCVNKLPGTKRIPVNIPVALKKDINRALPIALGIAAGLVTLLAGIAAHRYKKSQNQGKGSLNSALVEDEPTVELDIAGNAHVL